MTPPATLIDKLRNARRLLIVTHARPDGDCLGSGLALCLAARAAGKTATLLVPDKIPDRYAFLLGEQPPAMAAQFDALADEADLLVVVDTSSPKQLDGIDGGVLARASKTVVIDHHPTAQNLADTQWIDPSAAAAGVMAAETIAALGWPLDLHAAEALLVAVTSDTGWLRFANTDGRCLHHVAAWLEMGLRPDKVYAKLYQCDRPQRLRLMARMLTSLELYCDDQLATMVIRHDDFAQSGALPEDTENLVNEALRIGSVETALLLVENGGQPSAPAAPGQAPAAPVVRVSLRSRDAVDVAAVAAKFGGGGHARAAGVRVAMPIDQLKAQLVAACTAALAAPRQ